MRSRLAWNAETLGSVSRNLHPWADPISDITRFIGQTVACDGPLRNSRATSGSGSRPKARTARGDSRPGLARAGVAGRGVAAGPSDHEGPDLEQARAGQPAPLPRPGLVAGPGAALQVDPEHLPRDGLDVDVPPADLQVVEDHVGPGVAADHGERLGQGPRLARRPPAGPRR